MWRFLKTLPVRILTTFFDWVNVNLNLTLSGIFKSLVENNTCDNVV